MGEALRDTDTNEVLLRALFAPGDDCYVNGDIPARVVAVQAVWDAVSYKVVYWHEGDRKEIWCEPFELREKP